MNRGHLRRQHRLEFIPRLHVLHHREHEIKLGLVQLSVRSGGGGDLPDKTFDKIKIRRSQRRRQERFADGGVWMIQVDSRPAIPREL